MKAMKHIQEMIQLQKAFYTNSLYEDKFNDLISLFVQSIDSANSDSKAYFLAKMQLLIADSNQYLVKTDSQQVFQGKNCQYSEYSEETFNTLEISSLNQCSENLQKKEPFYAVSGDHSPAFEQSVSKEDSQQYQILINSQPFSQTSIGGQKDRSQSCKESIQFECENYCDAQMSMLDGNPQEKSCNLEQEFKKQTPSNMCEQQNYRVLNQDNSKRVQVKKCCNSQDDEDFFHKQLEDPYDLEGQKQTYSEKLVQIRLKRAQSENLCDNEKRPSLKIKVPLYPIQEHKMEGRESYNGEDTEQQTPCEVSPLNSSLNSSPFFTQRSNTPKFGSGSPLSVTSSVGTDNSADYDVANDDYF